MATRLREDRDSANCLRKAKKVSVPIVPDIINMDLGRTVKFMDEQKAELSHKYPYFRPNILNLPSTSSTKQPVRRYISHKADPLLMNYCIYSGRYAFPLHRLLVHIISG
ncbi:unnamed protein product [Dracunculus medinensis]|uniref:GST N-terminal domain-containing protein n=1 Tax=Dracunculus medinensis TaxID=318479 RepID=A0A0N4UD52_DRAME|nr:unnamed protein product [Dracunculus medinensis]